MSDLLLDTVRGFASSVIAPVAASVDATGRVPSPVTAQLTEMGLFTLVEDGLPVSDVLAVVEELARVSAAVALLVAVPEASCSGSLDRTGLHGVRVPVPASDTALLGCAAVALGVAARAHELTAEYAAGRVVFGRPMTAFAVLADALDRMSDEIARARAGLSAGPVPAAVGAARAATRVTRSAIQLHGGYGYMVEYGIERLARDAISLRALVASLTA